MTPTSPSSSPSAASGKSVWTSGIGRRPPTIGRPAPRPVAEQPAAGERVQRLDDLVAGAERVGERVEPDVDARADVVEQVGHERAAGDEQDEADDDEAEPAGRRVEQREEHGEEQQRRAEVALDDDDAERDRPHRDHRGEVRQRRQAERAEPGVLLDEQRPVLRQVAGEEHDEDDLEQLGRLAADRAEPQASAAGRRRRRRRRTSAAAARCRPPPTCTCSAAASVSERTTIAERRGDAIARHQPDELDVAEAERRAADVERHEVLRQPLHEQQRDPAEQPDDGQQDLVGPPAGEDLARGGRSPSAPR